MTVSESKDALLLSHLMGIQEAALREHLWLGHRAYLARLRTLSVACGWSATGEVAMFGGTCHFTRPTKQPIFVWVCDPPRLARSRHLPSLAASHPAHRGARVLLDHSPAREYVFSTRDIQSWLSTSWSFILHTRRWTWLDSTSWRQRAGTGGKTASWAPSHRGDRRHIAEANYLKTAALLLIAPLICQRRSIQQERVRTEEWTDFRARSEQCNH